MTDSVGFSWCCVAAVNRPEILAENLAVSPCLAKHPNSLAVFLDQPSASIAYNRGLDSTQADVVVFAHQDVYLPSGWDQVLLRSLAQLDEIDPNWAVAGLVGLTLDNSILGHVWSTGLAREIGSSSQLPSPTTCIDELLIILKRNSGIRFDPELPSFHLYGTDIVRTALGAGYGAYIINAPVIHNSRCLLYTSPSPRDQRGSRMPSSA